MTDNRELLELAANAAGIDIRWALLGDTYHAWLSNEVMWNPLTDDGDALRLAVKLRLKLEINDASVVVYFSQNTIGETLGPIYEYPPSEQGEDWRILHVNHDAATRRAIVRAAAEIGRSTK